MRSVEENRRYGKKKSSHNPPGERRPARDRQVHTVSRDKESKSQTFQDSADLCAAKFLRHFLIWCCQWLLSPREMILELRLRCGAEQEHHSFLSLPWMRRHALLLQFWRFPPWKRWAPGLLLSQPRRNDDIRLEHCYHLRVRKYQDHGWQV